MKYSKMLKELFAGIELNVEDLLLLETFQIIYLPKRVPHKEFASLIRKYPYIKKFFELKNPSIRKFIENILETNEAIENESLVDNYCNELLWEIADLIVYNKHPELYDEKVKFTWSIEEIVEKQSLQGKIVADIGSGSGFLAFLLSQFAETVFAIEPISSFRSFIKKKAIQGNYKNVYALDGLLEAIPFPDSTFDILFTSNAIGWNIEKELQEIERTVKTGGQAIHIMRIKNNIAENPFHELLTSEKWNYEFIEIQNESGIKLKYSKRF